MKLARMSYWELFVAVINGDKKVKQQVMKEHSRRRVAHRHTARSQYRKAA